MNEPAPRRRRNLGDAASFVAVALSLFALATSAYQARLMRDQTQLMQVQSRASVWPSLAIGENDVHSSTEDSFTWRVDNNGVGPAKIESVIVSLDGKPYRDWQSVAAVLAPDAESAPGELPDPHPVPDAPRRHGRRGEYFYRTVAELYGALPGQRRRDFRLLGVQASGLVPAGAEQLAMLHGERWGDVGGCSIGSSCGSAGARRGRLP